jgi:hemoglobin
VAEFVGRFYSRVAEDPLLGPIFVGQANVDWDEHIPRLTAFWCKIELGIPGFSGAPTAKHSALSRVQPFEARHFERWIQLFTETIEGGWSGPRVESMIARAVQIAQVQSRAVERAEPWSPG